jgi:hypothetical protein
MGTDWFAKVKCPRPDKKVDTQAEHIRICSGCPYVIWNQPEPVAGFMSSMCAVRVGSIGMAAELDEIAQNLSGIERFTKIDSSAANKLAILQMMKFHILSTGWTVEGLTHEDMLSHIDLLIDFCKRAKDKGLDIRSWA